LDLVKDFEKGEGKEIAYFVADLVNSEELIFMIERDNCDSHQVNMVTTMFYDSYDKEEDFTEDEGEDTDCDDPEYGNPDLKFMKNRVQKYPRITKEEDTYDKLMMKYDLSMVYRVGNDTVPKHPRMLNLWR
jgi:hypothetical protein